MTSEKKESSSYALPNGFIIQLSGELRCDVTETIFNEYLTPHALPPAIAYAIRQCPLTVQDQLWSNIILSGGNTKFNGFSKRLLEELRLLERRSKVEVHSVYESKGDCYDDAWVGTSKLIASGFCNKA